LIAAASAWTIRVFAACAVFVALRLILGPRGADRLAALSVLSALVLAALVLYGVTEGRVAYLDVALVYDIFGFLGILAVSAFIKEKP
jgi:multicomponent Na+:H+ antiporter subunit F